MLTELINFDVRNPWGMISDGLRRINSVHQKSTNAILGTNTESIDENKNRHDLFKFIMALVRSGYMYEDEISKKRKADLNQEAKTQNLSMPADEPSYITAA